MADPPTTHDTDEDTGDESQREPSAGTSRWQKAVGIVGVVVVVWVVSRLLGAGGGEHGPGRHLPGSRGPIVEASAGEGGHAPPQGGH